MACMWTAEPLTIYVEILKLILWGLTTLGGAFLGSFLGSYMKKKGENRAIHEDISKLVEQVQAVTKATKEIEAKISSDIWDRQKRWELKREVLFEATRRISEIDDALLSLHSVLQEERLNGDPEELAWKQAKHERLLRWSKASTAFDETRLFVRIVCSKETGEAFDIVGIVTNQIAAKISQKDGDFYSNSKTDLFKSLLTARSAVRKELGIDSAAQTPI